MVGVVQGWMFVEGGLGKLSGILIKSLKKIKLRPLVVGELHQKNSQGSKILEPHSDTYHAIYVKRFMIGTWDHPVHRCVWSVVHDSAVMMHVRMLGIHGVWVG